MSEPFAGPAYLICGDARTGSSLLASTPVSYTHLTLPTIYSV